MTSPCYPPTSAVKKGLLSGWAVWEMRGGGGDGGVGFGGGGTKHKGRALFVVL